jgi:hypothetical protein
MKYEHAIGILTYNLEQLRAYDPVPEAEGSDVRDIESEIADLEAAIELLTKEQEREENGKV